MVCVVGVVGMVGLCDEVEVAEFDPEEAEVGLVDAELGFVDAELGLADAAFVFVTLAMLSTKSSLRLLLLPPALPVGMPSVK